MEQDDPLGWEGGGGPRAEGASDVHDPIDWEAIEHDFIHGDWSIERIAEARGSSATTISKRAKQEGWVRLVGTKRLRSGRKPNPPGTPRPKAKRVAQQRRANMLRRLFNVLDIRLAEIEERMAKAEANGEASSIEVERDMRSLSALARIYAKLIELDEAARAEASKEARGSEVEARSEDADQFRRDLALRLDRLNRARDA